MKDLAKESMKSISVTLDTFQLLSGWLKEVASLNILSIFVTFDTQEAAAHAYNAAIRRAGLEGRRNINLVVDGQLVPKKKAPKKKAPRKRRREEEEADLPTCAICFDPTSVTLVCGHAMCEECMGRLAVYQGQTVTRSRRRVVIQCPLRCLAPTERVLA